MKTVRVSFEHQQPRDDDEIESILGELANGELSVRDFRLIDRERLVFDLDLDPKLQITGRLLD